MSAAKQRARRRPLVAVVLAALVAGISLVATSPSGAASTDDAARERHERVTDYWTAERIADAIPRDMTV